MRRKKKIQAWVLAVQQRFAAQNLKLFELEQRLAKLEQRNELEQLERER